MSDIVRMDQGELDAVLDDMYEDYQYRHPDYEVEPREVWARGILEESDGDEDE